MRLLILRTRIATFFLFAYVLATLGQLVPASPMTQKGDRGGHVVPGALSPSEVSALRDVLPPQGVVAFRSKPFVTSSWAAQGADLFWAQFELAPLVLTST